MEKSGKKEITIDDLGTRMTEEHVELAFDPTVDAFSLDQRIAAYRNLEAQHQEAKKAIHAGQWRPPRDFWIYICAGDVGDHKTHVATAIYAALYAWGMDFIHNASHLFGVRADPVHIYTFAKNLPRHSLVSVDEAHSVLSIYRENADRNVYFNDGLAFIRKLNCKVILASAFDRRISRSAKDMCVTVLIPWQAPLPPRAKYPAFCYVWDNVITPYPYSERGIRDEYEIPRRMGHALPRTNGMHSPRTMWEAAKLMDSFETPDLAYAIEMNAAKIREALKGAGPGEADYDEENAAETEGERHLRVLRAYGTGLAYASGGHKSFLNREATHVATVLQTSFGLDDLTGNEIIQELRKAGVTNSRSRMTHDVAQAIFPEEDWDWTTIMEVLK